MESNKINWKNAIIGGLLGTIAFDLFGLMMMGEWWDIPALLGDKTGLGLAYGVFGHYSNGILIAILYAGIAPSLFGPNWFRTLFFVTAETVALVWFFMFPLVGAGVMGLEMGMMMTVGSLMRHWVYAIPLYYFVHQFNTKTTKAA